MRTLVAFLSLILVSPFLGAQTPEDRLVEAELLEVSAGDLERAMAAYKAIASDEKTPAPVKARALLALGRSQRKAGQLESAKKTLGDLIAAHPEEAETIRQAKGFLEELESGRARNPAFDWIADVEKSPEIQARVFDWCMVIVGSDSKAAAGAARQLLALGPIALPVVERVLDASRDDTQRYLLAMIAVRSGRLERLAQLLEAEDVGMSSELYRFSFWQYLESVGEMPERERARILEAAMRVPETPKNGIRRAALLLATGDPQDLARKVKTIEGSQLASTGLLGKVLEREPALADLFAERAKDRALSPGVRLGYLDALLWKAPGKLGPEHLDLLEEQRPETEHRLQSLDAASRHDLLEGLAAGPAGAQLFNYYLSQHRDRRSTLPAPAAWARILRKMRQVDKAPRELQLLGEANDEAAGELAAFLANRSTESPEYTGDGGRPDREWTPSPRYAELMAGLLQSDDAVTLAIALEALALARADVGPEVLPVLERLVLTPPDIHVREFAVYALLARFAARPETGPGIARILLEDFRLRGCKTADDTILRGVIPQNLGRVVHTHGVGGSNSALDWVFNKVEVAAVREMLPHVLALGASDETRGFYHCYRRFLRPDVAEAILDVLPRLDTSARRAAAVLLLAGDMQKSEGLVRSHQGLELLKTVATDKTADLGARVIAVERASGSASDWFDWPRFLQSDDPLLTRLESWKRPFASWLEKQPLAEQDDVLKKLESTPFLRVLRVLTYPQARADRVQVLEAALQNRETEDYAVHQLLEIQSIRGPDLYRKLLETPSGRASEFVHRGIREYSDEKLIEPLVNLLDDPQPRVRKLSLETLQTIRAALEQKKEWQAIVEAMKARKKE